MMRKSNEENIEPCPSMSLIDLPRDLLILHQGATESTSITSVLPEKGAHAAIKNLSMTCKQLNRFFKTDTMNFRAKQLLEYVLNATTHDKEKVIAAAKLFPEIFFIKASAQDPAMDLEGNHRFIKDWSPYQAMFGTGDIDMLAAVRRLLNAYLDKLPNGHQMAAAQIKEKFPNGFDYPESTYDFQPLIEAINNDTAFEDPKTLKQLAKFKKDFKPGIVTTGHHFNMNDLLKVVKINQQNFQPWTASQIGAFANVIGYIQRLLSRYHLMAVCQGLKNITIKPFERCVYVGDYIHQHLGVAPTIKIIPLDSTNSHFPELRLGQGYYLGRYSQGWMKGDMIGIAHIHLDPLKYFKNYCDRHIKTLAEFALDHAENTLYHKAIANR